MSDSEDVTISSPTQSAIGKFFTANHNNNINSNQTNGTNGENKPVAFSVKPQSVQFHSNFIIIATFFFCVY
jgi:hypothetical protein